MKTSNTLKISGITAAILAVILAGCFVIVTVNQPSSALGGAQITATVTVSVEGQSDATPHYGIAGFLVPNGWTIDTVYFTGAYSDHMTFLHPDSSDKEPGGQVDFWTDSLEGRYPSGADYQWIVYQSSTSHLTLVDTVDVLLNVQMTTAITQGNFNLGYFVSDAALDFSDPTWYDVSLNNAILISGVVPVELTSFSASVAKDAVTLKWETATETNNRGFEIERSQDSKAFSAVGFIDGRGTTSEKSNYNFVDKNAADGINYYRLKQIDHDGTFSYSSVIEVDFSMPLEFNLSQNYPNPFNPTTSIKFGVPVDSKVMITIYNSVGEKVEVITNSNYAAGTHSLNLNGSNLSSGTYIYTLSAEGIDGSKFVQSNKMILMK